MSKDSDQGKAPVEPDYHVENGLVVMTASYLRRRGYCCGNGCRHCPYPKDSDTSNLNAS